MTLPELKNKILQNELINEFIIFKCSENTFIADQYIAEICNKKNYEINYINSLYEVTDSALALVFNFKNNINVLKLDEFSEIIDDYSELTNTVVICNKISKTIENKVRDYTIEIPKLLDWQVKDYMKCICPGLSCECYDYLYFIATGDIYRLTNELDKINLFDTELQNSIFSQLIYDKESDLYKVSILDLSNYIVSGNIEYIYKYLQHKNSVTFDPIALTNLLLNSFKKALYVFYPTGKQPEELNMTTGMFYAIQKNTKKFSQEAYRNIIKFLSGIDIRLKNYELDINNSVFIDYIICTVLSYLR